MSIENSWCAVSHPKNDGYEKVTTEINIVNLPKCATTVSFNKEGKPTDMKRKDMICVLGNKDWVKYLPLVKNGELDTSNCLVSIRRVVEGRIIEQQFETKMFKHFRTFEGETLTEYKLSDFIEGTLPDYLFGGKYWEDEVQSIAKHFPNAISIDWSIVDTTYDEELVQ